jgi:hypothetical protein
MAVRFSNRCNGLSAGVIDRRTAAWPGAVPPASFVLGGFNSLFDRLGNLSFYWRILKDFRAPYFVRERAQPSFCQFIPDDQGSGVKEFYPPDLAEGEPGTFGVGVRDGMAEAVGTTLDDGEPIGRPDPTLPAYGPPAEEEGGEGTARQGTARHGKARFMQGN